MKGKRNLLVGIVFLAIIGSAMVFYFLPFIVENLSLVLGFLAGLALVSVGLILLLILSNKSLIISWIGKVLTMDDSPSASGVYTFIWILVFAIIVFIFSISCLLIFNQNEMFKSQNNYQQALTERQVELIESVRKGGLVTMLSNILDKIDDELKQNPQRSLSDETIARISALSHYFAPEPYNYVERDSLTELHLSQERGQLLLILSHLRIDSVSFGKIKQKTSFAKADLRGSDLQGTNLRGVDLMSANLRDADLRGANLQEADMRGANLWGAKLCKADLREAALNRADLRWADLDDANMNRANLSGAVLSSAKLRKTDLTAAVIHYADLSGAFFNEANLSGANLFGTDLSKVNFSKANLNKVDLRLTNLSEANLYEANLSEVLFRETGVDEKNWLILLSELRVTGAKEIQKEYHIIEDLSGRANYLVQIVED